MAVDLILKFRLAAFPHKSPRPQTWQMDVMTIEDVTVPLTFMADLVEFVSPLREPPSAEAKDGYSMSAFA